MKKKLKPVALFLDGPYKGERRVIEPNQTYVAWAEWTHFQGWGWAVYKWLRRESSGIYTYQWVGWAWGRQLEFSYVDNQLVWPEGAIGARGEVLMDTDDPEDSWEGRSLRSVLEQWAPEVLEVLERKV